MASLAGPRTFSGYYLPGRDCSRGAAADADLRPARTRSPRYRLWYTLAILYVILQRWIPRARWHAPLQIVCDLLIITAVVYTTGVQDSYFISLYLLAILMGGIMFSWSGAFLRSRL